MSTLKTEWFHYVIYKSPADFPGQFVIRRWRIANPPRPDAMPLKVGTLQECRAKVPPTHVKMMPSAKDDKAIYEVWV